MDTDKRMTVGQPKPAHLEGPTSAGYAPPQTGWSLRDLLIVLCKRYRMIATFFFAALITAFASLVFGQPGYEVTAAMLVKKQRTEIPFAPTAAAEPIIVEVTEEDLNSEIEILKGRSLLRQVIADLDDGTSSPPSFVSRLTGDVKNGIKTVLGMPILSAADSRLLSLEQNLTFTAVARSNILELRYETDDPERAAATLSSLIDRYLDYRIEVHQVPRALEFFDDQQVVAEARLGAAEGAMEQFVQETGLSLPHESQKEATLQKLDQFERLLGESTVQLRENEDRVRALQERVRVEPPRIATADRFNSDPDTEEIGRNLVQLRSQRDDLLTRGYNESNVRVLDLNSQILLGEQRLTEAEERVGEINRTEVNQIHQNLKAELLSAEAELEGARGRNLSLRVQVADFRRELDNLNRRSFQVSRLGRELKTAEDAYLLYQGKAEEAKISGAMDDEKNVNVSIARAPERPLKPAGPSKVTVLASAFLLAGIGGLSLAFGREFLDHSFTTGDDIERVLGIPHLASIPDSHLAARDSSVRLSPADV